MKIKISKILSYILLLSCKQTAPTKHTDSLITENFDTSANQNPKKNSDADADSISIDERKYFNSKFVKENFEENYKDTLIVDTIFKRGIDDISLSFSYYTDRYKTVTVPDKYTEIFGLKNYTAPAFVSSFHLAKNRSTLLDTTFSEEIFDNIIPAEFKGHVILLGPEIKYKPDGIYINYSITIPLTDIATWGTLKIDYNGRTTTYH